MPIRISLLIICFVLFSACSINKKTQRIILKVEKSRTENLRTDSVLSKIQQTNDLIIGYSIYNDTWRQSPIQYFLIGFRKNKEMSYHYTINRMTINDQSPYIIDSAIVSNNDKNKILTAFKKAKGWSLNHLENDSTTNYCSQLKNINDGLRCMIHDASYKNLIIMTKKATQIATFYAPEYFEYECCPGNQDRQDFFAIIAPIVHYFSKTIHVQ